MTESLRAAEEREKLLRKVLTHNQHVMERAFADPDSLKTSERAMNAFCYSLEITRAALTETALCAMPGDE